MGFLGRGTPPSPAPLPSQLGDLGESRELPQHGPRQNPCRQRILGIFQGLRNLLLEAMHYRVCGVLENLIQALSRTRKSPVYLFNYWYQFFSSYSRLCQLTSGNVGAGHSTVWLPFLSEIKTWQNKLMP